jgi:CheY-like chemotaxis protein
MGFEVVATQDGTEAYTRASEIHPEIIVTELAMPNCDGWQLLEQLKQDSRTVDIPVVVITGYLQWSLRECTEHQRFGAFFQNRVPRTNSLRGFVK